MMIKLKLKRIDKILKNYKTIFVLEILTFILISFLEVLFLDGTVRLFGTELIYGLPLFSWVFALTLFLFFLIPVHIRGFDSKLLGTWVIGYLIGNIFESFIWFAMNPSFGFSKFNSDYIPGLVWIRIGGLEIPKFYLTFGLLSLIFWFIFIKYSKKIDRWLKLKPKKRT